MVNISGALGSQQAQTYYQQAYTSAADNYYSDRGQIAGEWHGRLAAQWGLSGAIDQAHYDRLANGQHPVTGEQLVRHVPVRGSGHQATMAHRAGWDATFSAPKSVSLTALVAGDDRVTQAHQAAVRTAIDVALEPHVQAHCGGSHAPETTGQLVAALFQHDSARPVDGYAAPQLHTHVVLINMTARDNGDVRPLQERELFRSQHLATAVYRSELAARLTDLGYHVEREAKTDAPIIVGYSDEYLTASSPRRAQIVQQLEVQGRSGAGAAQIAAHRTREAKVHLEPDVVKQQHQELAAQYGHQAARVRADAIAHPAVVHEPITADAAVTYAKHTLLERDAVIDERALLREALVRSMGERTPAEIRTALNARLASPEFVQAPQPERSASRHYTTPEMVQLEMANIRLMHASHGQRTPLAAADIRRDVQQQYAHLNPSQLAAVEQVLTNRDGVQALAGSAGVGKTTTLAAITDAAERAGYHVHGLAPTSRATALLRDAGMTATTLQRHITASKSDNVTLAPRLYVLDEASLASTVQVHAFLSALTAHDRVLLVGDQRQHHGVDAGVPFDQCIASGVATTQLRAIVRQPDPELRRVVEHLADGHVPQAIHALSDQGRVHAIPDRDARYQAIAADYVANPTNTLVVSPDNASRQDINQIIHEMRRSTGTVATADNVVPVLVARQELTGADRQWAARYQVGDVIRYSKASQLIGVQAGSYARVTQVRPDDNKIQVRRDSGKHVTYDPKRVHGVTVFQAQERHISVGDRVQFTAPDRRLHVTNRQLATVEAIAPSGALTVRLDEGRTLVVDAARKHVDLGYALTSHSSQGQTAARVLVHADTAQSEQLVNRRFAYVALSRARHEAKIYTNTNEPQQLVRALSRDVSHTQALTREQVQQPVPVQAPRQVPRQEMEMSAIP